MRIARLTISLFGILLCGMLRAQEAPADPEKPHVILEFRTPGGANGEHGIRTTWAGKGTESIRRRSNYESVGEVFGQLRQFKVLKFVPPPNANAAPKLLILDIESKKELLLELRKPYKLFAKPKFPTIRAGR